jgi:hypothetical protein
MTIFIAIYFLDWTSVLYANVVEGVDKGERKIYTLTLTLIGISILLQTMSTNVHRRKKFTLKEKRKLSYSPFSFHFLSWKKKQVFDFFVFKLQCCSWCYCTMKEKRSFHLIKVRINQAVCYMTTTCEATEPCLQECWRFEVVKFFTADCYCIDNKAFSFFLFL